MKINVLSIITMSIIGSMFLLSACSGSDETNATSKSDSGAKNDALMGYKRSLDTAKSITSMAAESEQKKNQAIQDLD